MADPPSADPSLANVQLDLQSTDVPEPAQDSPLSSVPDEFATNIAESTGNNDNVSAIPAQQPFYIDVPHLSREQKALYEPNFGQRLMGSDLEFDDQEIDSIIGEYEEKGRLFYYVKVLDGIAHKFPAKQFRADHPRLVSDYEQRKASGTLDPFDPSAHYVHPSSRVRMVLNFNPKKDGRRTQRTRSADSAEFAMSRGSDQGSTPSDSRSQRRSRRAVAANASKRIARNLPYSPTKAPQNTGFAPDSEFDSDSDVQELPVLSRRSTRIKKTRNYDYGMDPAEDDVSSDEFSGYSVDPEPQPRQKQKKRGKASRPAYGRFRIVADLAIDEEEAGAAAPLRAHRSTCEKCHLKPANELLAGLGKAKNRRRKKKTSDDEEEEEGDEQEKFESLGGWVRCLKCPVAAHWGCLAKTQRDEILKAAHGRDQAEWRLQVAAVEEAREHGTEAKILPEPAKRADLNAYQTTEFICGSCTKGGVCMVCREVAIKADTFEVVKPENEVVSGDGPGKTKTSMSQSNAAEPGTVDKIDNDNDSDASPSLVFRCITCKRVAHYEHLPPSDDIADFSLIDIAEYYQSTTGWQCADCFSYVYTVEHILAWRPFPEDAVEPAHPNEPLNYKSMLPREYLIKWADRSYRRASWVPHGWLLATHGAKLKNFLQGGTKVQLLAEPNRREQQDTNGLGVPAFELVGNDELPEQIEVGPVSLLSSPDAEQRIPPAWKTVDRVLDVLLRKSKRTQNSRRRRRERTDSEEEESSDSYDDLKVTFEQGEPPGVDFTDTVEEYVTKRRDELKEGDIHRVVYGFFKWQDLGYEDASWDSPPRKGDPEYPAFESAFRRYIKSRSVQVTPRTGKDQAVFDDRAIDAWKKHAFTHVKQPQLGQNSDLKLMPFQVDGVNWLCNNWWNHQHCILADEMGLGKTVQIATFVGYVISKHHAAPALVVVPNSTITNWVREFERWAPNLRVVPFYGDSKAREIIKQYELSHLDSQSAKFHVLVTTYEMITNQKEFGVVFKKIPRWEILVVDEGQRLKSDSSLIFKKLRDLKTIHRVIMTGTPLNNNIRELFALMNFLDPGEWADLDALSKQYEELSDESVKELHTRLKPYFLRRIKSEVLQLPPKNEVIVPVSMTPLQREIYRSILSQNLSLLRNLVMGSTGTSVSNAISKTNLNNMLMQLRKCLQHPYLVSDEIEPKGLSQEQAHAKLIDASSKIRLLKVLLPKLRERGHRVLLFSQFVIALDIIEDFLIGEGIKYLRLDGNTKQADRQKDMDEFNKPGSDVFIYLLTTRAGGVGINLWTADTVIIYDPDFNPHQDLQAIARAHRYGQKKTCLVFKLMVKGSAEDKIMQTGKKKLVLDHLIVQKMDDADGSKEDVQSILMFGAQTLFEEGEDAEERQINYSDNDIDKLIEKTEQEGDEVEPESGANAAFSFAKVWSADKDALEDIQDDAQESVDQVDSWAQTLERIAAERNKVQAREVTGRGSRRKAAAVFPQQKMDVDDGPEDGKKDSKRKGKKKRSKSQVSDSDAYPGTASDADAHSSDRMSVEPDDVTNLQLLSSTADDIPMPDAAPRAAARPNPRAIGGSESSTPLDDADILCGLCGGRHGDKPCPMTSSSENLAEYRLMLLCHADDEPLEERLAAIQAIDETLHQRGMTHLIQGQPLHLVQNQPKTKPKKKRKKDVPQPLFSATPAKKFSEWRWIDSRLGHSSTPPPSSVVKPSKTSSKKPPRPSNDIVASSNLPLPQIPLPRFVNVTTNGGAGPSKRALSPGPSVELPKKKRLKNGGPMACVICGTSPHHLAKDCPVVRSGPGGIEKAIQRLGNDPACVATVDILRKLLSKQNRSASGPAGPSHESAVVIND